MSSFRENQAFGLACRCSRAQDANKWEKRRVEISRQETFAGLGHFPNGHERMPQMRASARDSFFVSVCVVLWAHGTLIRFCFELLAPCTEMISFPFHVCVFFFNHSPTVERAFAAIVHQNCFRYTKNYWMSRKHKMRHE